MSLVTYPSSNKSKSPGRETKKSATRPGSGGAPTFARRLRNALVAIGRLVAKVHTTIAEARMQKAIIEAELYRSRYFYTSKNDDDLPIIR